VKIEQAETPDLLAAVPTEELDQSMSGSEVSPDGMRAPASVVGEIAAPTHRERARWMPFPV